MHDGLHFAADSLADVLSQHGLPMHAQPVVNAKIPREYGV
jgi:hypothetical protein